MAGGKETPRQKMIGMMYLVLTALLAMNISKDVLNAFLQINRSQIKTSEILNSKAQASLAALNAPKPEDAAKAVPFQQKASEVIAKTQDVVKYMEELKARTMAASMKSNNTGDGFEEFMENGKALDMLTATGKEKISKPDENTNATALLIGSKPHEPKETPWSGNELKKKLEEYAQFVRGVSVTNIDDKPVTLPEDIVASIDSAFHFAEEKDLDGKGEPWEVNRFHDTPLAACIATMSMLQTSVMNTQAQILSWLQGSINATDIKFTDVTVAAVPLQSYVLKGDEFQAEIFLAAYNKNSTTKIYPGGEYSGDRPSEVTPGAGASGGGIESGPDGKCIFKVNTSGLTLGTHGFKGQISYLKDGQEQFLNYFIPPMTVGAPALVVSPVNMNVFYRGLDNPVEISVPGVDPSALRVSMDGGSISGLQSDGTYNVKPGDGKEAVIRVSANINGKDTPMPAKNFRIKRIPDPVPSFGGKKPYDSTIPQGDASVAAGVRAEMEGFDFPVTASVTKFVVSMVANGQYKEYACSSNKISDDASAAIKKMKKGEKFFIEQIMCKMPDGTERKLSPITLKIV
jgi:gliding motility-associated protein GldM